MIVGDSVQSLTEYRPDVLSSLAVGCALAFVLAWIGSLPTVASGSIDVALLAGAAGARKRDDGSLGHEARQEIYDAIVDTPGIYLSAISDETDIPLGTVRHHVRILKDENLVSSRKVRGKRRHFPVGLAPTNDAELRAALDDEATAAVVDALARSRTATVSELAARLERDPSTISHHLARLEEAGIVERERRDQSVVSWLDPDARSAATAEASPATPDPGSSSGVEGAE